MASPAYSALIIDESNPENRRAVYTFSYWLNNLAGAIGGLIGAFLFEDYYFYLFLGMSMIALLTLIITIFFIEDHYEVAQSKVEPEKKRSKGSLFEVSKVYMVVIKDYRFGALALANLLIIAVEEQLTSFIGLRLTEDLPKPIPLLPFLDVDVDGFNLVGILKAENTILVVCLTVVVSFLLKRLKDRSVLLGGIVLFFCGYAVISFNSVPIVLILAMFIATLGELMNIPVKQALLANMVPDHARSSYMAVYGLLSMGGSLMAGVFIFLYGRVPSFFLTAVFVLMGILTFIIFWRLTKTEATSQHINKVKIG
ncbi:MFS transporter [Psychrobacillus vulpis]|uniref:MFS transporter n=1 Tax=Psychrobacillus vulpis TaxID=2325572 RepID=UPI001F0F69EE|nr:MFS transporter [Psychrobacillus vulpis]